MPELPEVELVVRDLNRVMAGRTILRARVIWPGYVEGLKPGNLGKTLKGERFERAGRLGKFILITLTRYAMLNHLRMTGRILKLPPGENIPKHTHVIFDLDDGSRLLFSDVRKFGRLRVFPRQDSPEQVESLQLGLEPFGKQFTGRNLARLCRGRSRGIKNLLLDQTAVAGIGNIYACEILFAAGIDPFRSAGSVSTGEITKIIRSTRRILRQAIDNGGSSISDYVRVDGELGGMQNHFFVYGRAGGKCFRCRNFVTREVQVGRSTFWCRGCQL